MPRTVVLLAALLFAAFAVVASADEAAWVLAVEGEIGRGTVSYLRSGLDAARDATAELIVIVLSTPGGDVDSAVAARDLLLDARVHTLAFVNREAISAGALLAVSCDEIVFAPGAVLGAATPFFFDEQGQYREAPEKIQSAIRTLFRSTADARGRDPEIAEAMVDASIEIEGLTERGRLLTLSARDASAWGYSNGDAESLNELLTSRGFRPADAITYQARFVDRVVEAFTAPVLATLFLVVGLLGLIIEMMLPGFGIAGGIGIVCLGAFFWSHVLVGLAGWESIAFLLGGLLAVFFEIFVFTAADFGLAGIAGLTLVGLGFYTAMVGPFSDRTAALRAIGIVSAGLVFTVIVAVLLIAKLPRTRLRFGGVILSSAITGRAFDKQERIEQDGDWIGRRGRAATDLRPVGVGEFDGERVDVICEEGHLPEGMPIVVTEDKGFRKTVRKMKED
jgi:membrane-bound serine protease (ClpP class)